MKFIWEENDIEPGWRVLSASSKTECIIGYRYDTQNKGEKILTLISLDDGLQINSFGLAEEHKPIFAQNSTMVVGIDVFVRTASHQMAEFLNEHGYTPQTLTRWG